MTDLWCLCLQKSTCAANVGTKSARHFGEVMQTILAPTEHAIGQNGEGIGPRQQVSAPVRKRMANLVPWPRQEGQGKGGPLTGGFSKLPGRHLVAFWRVLGQGVNIPDNTQKLEATILIRLVRRGAGVFGLSAAVAVPTHAPKLSAFGLTLLIGNRIVNSRTSWGLGKRGPTNE